MADVGAGHGGIGSASLRAAALLLTGGGTTTSLAAPFASLLRGMTAAVSVLGDPFGIETLAATGPTAAQCAEAQIDLGEGPIWVARSLRRPLLLPDAGIAGSGWPAFAAVLETENVRSVFAFPMRVGDLDVGVVSLYGRRTLHHAPDDLHDTLLLVSMVARLVLQRAVDDASADGPASALEFLSRREVHQATGMVLAQLGISAKDALLTIRGYAYATGASVRDVSHAIVARELDLSIVLDDEERPER